MICVEKKRHSFPFHKLKKDIQQLIARDRVKAARRLVKDEQLRMMGKCERNAEYFTFIPSESCLGVLVSSRPNSFI